jgi:uncharacterized protein
LPTESGKLVEIEKPHFALTAKLAGATLPVAIILILIILRRTSMLNNSLRLFQLFFLSAVLIGAATIARADATKTVYHVHDGLTHATHAMYNIMFQLKGDPKSTIVVVANFEGIKAFTKDAKDAMGKSFSAWVDDLSVQGVEFRVCQQAMDYFKVTKDQLLDGISVVPSGVGEIARLQSQEGFGYIRP